jgi:hypothetical protein
MFRVEGRHINPDEAEDCGEKYVRMWFDESRHQRVALQIDHLCLWAFETEDPLL